MSPEARAEADAYYRNAQSWATDRVQQMHASRRAAWIVASAATAVALALAIVILVLLPLKTVVPYTLLVDRQTGYVQALNPIDANRIAPDATLTQSFLVQYVIAREGFDFATVKSDYTRVVLWSTDAARSAYAAAIQVSNPDSPLNRLPRGAIIETRVRSVSSLGGNTALVRFETVRRDRGGASQATQNWVAVVSYRFSTAPMSVEDRFINPLGFQVVRYRRNAETLPAIGTNEQGTTPPDTAHLPGPTRVMQSTAIPQTITRPSLAASPIAIVPEPTPRR